jgi:hypothetical protein
MEFLFKHTWIFFIAITIVNAFIFKNKTKIYINKNPELQEGYNSIFKYMIIYGTIPWIIMAIGDLTGLTESTFDFLNPRSLNPIVLIFYLVIFFIWGLGLRWIYFRNGAEFIERHPGLIQKRGFGGDPENISAKQIKIFFALALIGGTSGIIMMWMMNV